ncbi:MAG: cyclic lactone autoinducer peptide [Oscillospiraceae bacterium]|nr:cyclic lactone autoinducer peptide [Oscillospiraceae bacterium]
MKNSIKTAVLKIAAKAALGTAKKACGAASAWDCYQPKEPKALKKTCKGR